MTFIAFEDKFAEWPEVKLMVVNCLKFKGMKSNLFYTESWETSENK